MTFFKNFLNCLKRRKNVVWQSADGRVTSDHCHVTVQRLFSKFSQIAWNVLNRLFDSRPTVAWPPTTVAWPFSDFSQKFLNCLKPRKTLFDSRPTVAWPPTTVTWPFSDFFQHFPKLLETLEKRCLTVGRRSRDLRLLSRDRSATFFKIFNQIAWNVRKTLFDSRPTVRMTSNQCHVTDERNGTAPHTLAYVSFSLFLLCAWQSADGPVTSDYYYSFFPPNSLFTYLLLQEWSHPGNFDIISKLGIGRREFLILAGKFQLVDSLWGKTFPHDKHKRRSKTYLLREIPVKNRESLSRGVNTRENCRVNTWCNFFSFFCKLHDAARYSLSLSLSLSSLSHSLSQSLSLSLFSHYKYNIHRLAVPANRRPVWAGDTFTPARASFNGDAGWWNGQRHNMAVPVWSVTEILSLSSFSLIHAYMCLTVSPQSLIPYEGKHFAMINISDVAPNISYGRFPWKIERA